MKKRDKLKASTKKIFFFFTSFGIRSSVCQKMHVFQCALFIFQTRHQFLLSSRVCRCRGTELLPLCPAPLPGTIWCWWEDRPYFHLTSFWRGAHMNNTMKIRLITRQSGADSTCLLMHRVRCCISFQIRTAWRRLCKPVKTATSCFPCMAISGSISLQTDLLLQSESSLF